ncbi:hypothetical protein, partial [Lonsdalea britannica]|uniref:hypothetical protein n=1 Tax=Lonsdalea britannica TaxID=1082704 RepID=UPI0026F2B06B
RYDPQHLLAISLRLLQYTPMARKRFISGSSDGSVALRSIALSAMIKVYLETNGNPFVVSVIA